METIIISSEFYFKAPYCELTSDAKLLYAHLYTQALTGQEYISCTQKDAAKLLHCTEGTAGKALRSLQDIGLIERFVARRKETLISVYGTDGKPIQPQETLSDSSSEEDNIETQIYADNTYHFSISIPKDWTQVIDHDTVSYIHKPSGATIRMEVFAYDPAINNVAADTLSASITQDGKTFKNFTRKSASSYEVMYQDLKNSTYDYIEEVYWDREHIIRLSCIFNDEIYEKILPYIEKMLNSFSWNAENPIPDGYALQYLSADQFEFAYPDTWVLGTSSNSIVTMDQSSNASMTITMQDYDSSLSSMTATDMAQLIGSDKQNFMMNSFQASDAKATAKATYVVDSVQMQLVECLIWDGSHLFSLNIAYEQGTISDNLPETCISLFRSFASQN